MSAQRIRSRSALSVYKRRVRLSFDRERERALPLSLERKLEHRCYLRLHGSTTALRCDSGLETPCRFTALLSLAAHEAVPSCVHASCFVFWRSYRLMPPLAVEGSEGRTTRFLGSQWLQSKSNIWKRLIQKVTVFEARQSAFMLHL